MKTVLIVFLLFHNLFTFSQVNLTKFNELYNKGNYNEAVEEINRIIVTKGQPVSSELYYLQADAEYMVYVTGGKADQKSLENAYNSILNCTNAPDYSNFITKSVVVSGNIAREFYKTGINSYNREDYKSAQKEFQKAVNLFENINDLKEIQKLYYLLGFSSKYNGDNQNAEKYLLKLADKEYNDENIYLVLSEMYISDGKNENAKNILLKAVKKFNSENTYYDLIFNFYNSSDYNNAMKYINDYNLLNKESSRISMLEGTIHFNNNNPDSAVTSFKKVIVSDPSNFDANYNTGIILYNSGMKIMQNAEKEFYNSPDKYREEKSKYLGNIKEAAVYLENAYKIDNSNLNVAKCLADIYKRLQRNEEYEMMKKVIEQSK